MSSLALFLIAVIIPVFFASPRTAHLWLGIEALALAASVAAEHGLHTIHAAASIAEILLLRGWFAPWLLHRAISRRAETSEHLLPSNLLAWMVGIAVLALAFEFATTTATGETALALGGVSATVVLALLLLAFNPAPAAQLFAVLLIENAAALFESTLPEPWPWSVHVVLAVVYLLTVVVGVRMLSGAHDEPNAEVSRSVL